LSLRNWPGSLLCRANFCSDLLVFRPWPAKAHAKTLKSSAHRDRGKAKPRLHPDRLIDIEARPQPSLPVVAWLSTKDVGQ
jgi:hypothetical protein